MQLRELAVGRAGYGEPVWRAKWGAPQVVMKGSGGDEAAWIRRRLRCEIGCDCGDGVGEVQPHTTLGFCAAAWRPVASGV